MTSNVAVKVFGNKGRGLCAQGAISEGSIIFEESPFVSSQFSWNQYYGYAACHHCMRPLEKTQDNVRRLAGVFSFELLYPGACSTAVDEHRQCASCFVTYCSQKCFDIGQRYHQLYCDERTSSNNSNNNPFTILDEQWRNMHFPPETTSVNIVIRILTIINQSGNSQQQIHRLLDYCNEAIDLDSGLAHKMLGKEFESQVETLRQLVIAAFGDRTDNIDYFLTSEGFLKIWTILGRNSQGIGTSPVSEWVRQAEKINKNETESTVFDVFVEEMYSKMNEESGMFWNSEGSGLYDLQSKLNHSCIPNAEVTFPHNNHILAVEALRDIAPGEEITINYLDECDRNRSRHTRQKILENNYLFRCSCEKCVEQTCDMDMTSSSDEECDDE